MFIHALTPISTHTYRFAGQLPLASLAALCLGLTACNQQPPPQAGADDTQHAFQNQLISRLIQAKPDQVIELPAGRFELQRGLSLNVSGVTLRGAGSEATTLSFQHQKQGAEGLLIHADNIIIEDLAIEDTIGDAIKVNECHNLIIRRVRIEWTGGPDSDNGSYGLYPVQCENVLLEDNHVIGASDAGIYVGQSRQVVVRRNRAEYNVAGIEIENTIGADVYDNITTDNTGGILVFNLPDLTQEGHSTRVYRNRIAHNNTANFAPAGTAVASVPAGSGVVINANDRVEVFDNEISDNRTANIIISSYFSAGFAREEALPVSFDPYPETIYIHRNRFSGGGDSPDLLELKALKVAVFGFGGSLPDILWDGVFNPEHSENGRLRTEYAICIDNDGSGIVNIDAANDYDNIRTDMDDHRCHHQPLPPVQLPAALSAEA